MKTPYPVSVALVMGTLVSAWPAFAADAAKGKEVFQTNCAACHGADGTGTEIKPTIPHLSNPEFLSVASPGLLKAMIENGRPGRPMPTWKGILGADQIADVVAYLKGGAYTVEGPLLVGSALAGGGPGVEDALRRYARPLGLAFQLLDDLADGDAAAGATREDALALVARARAALTGPLAPTSVVALDQLAELVGSL